MGLPIACADRAQGFRNGWLVVSFSGEAAELAAGYEWKRESRDIKGGGCMSPGGFRMQKKGLDRGRMKLAVLGKGCHHAGAS